MRGVWERRDFNFKKYNAAERVVHVSKQLAWTKYQTFHCRGKGRKGKESGRESWMQEMVYYFLLFKKKKIKKINKQISIVWKCGHHGTLF